MEASPVIPVIIEWKRLRGAAVGRCGAARRGKDPFPVRRQLLKTAPRGGHGRVSHQAAVADSVLANGVPREPVSLSPAFMTHQATLGALRRGGSHAAEPGRAGSRYTRGPGELRKQLGAEPAEAGAPSQELELTYRSVKKLFVLVSYCWGGSASLV